MEVNQMLFECGWWLNELRMDSTLQELLGELLGGLGMNPVEPLEALLPLYKLLSRNLYNTGKTKEAVKVLERIGHLEKLKLAEDHPSRLALQHALAGAYRANGQVKEAVQVLGDGVKGRETTLAED